ncbi:hypothetical protein AB0D12_31830 [Streptomyces sp. NPDC048479]|uniref:hypothetical protein n=1 Tax=Streptomyces sp. NPDC048479 TaxID=3154725 RepID=UPI00341E12DD
MLNTTAVAVPRLLPNEARALVNATRPDAQDFQPEYNDRDTYVGYTFQDGIHYGWLSADGTVDGHEMYRRRAEFDLVEHARAAANAA